MERALKPRESIATRRSVPRFARVAVTLALVLLGLAAAGIGQPAGAALWQRPGSGTDLWYSGFLHTEGSLTGVTGSVYEYEKGYFRGRDEASVDLKGSFHANGFLRQGLSVNSTILFDTRYRRYPQRYWDRRFWDTFRMKLVMDKPREINDRWQFHARAEYDRLDTWRDEYPDARLLMEPIDDARLEAFAHLESRSLILEGGDMKPDYGGRGFVLYQRDILGLRANAHNDAVEADLTGGRVKGTTFLQSPDDSLGIRADGTAGPYRLAHAPIVRGSEVVSIEVRDRFDPTILLRRTTQRRNVDYTVDYLRGVLVFMEPIQSETFENDPVYISIQYSFDDRDTGYRRYLAATRTMVKMGEHARAGLLYAGVYDDAGSWRGSDTQRPPSQRLGAYGGVLQADLFERTSVEATAALSDSGRLGDNADHNRAFGVHMESRDIPLLALKGDYQRIEHGFEPLDNRALIGQGNRERLELEGTVRAAATVDLLGGQRTTRSANPEYDALAYTDRATYGGLAYRPWQSTEFTYRHEWRSAVDVKPVHQKQEYRETATLEGKQAVGETDLRLALEREHFTDDAHVGAELSRTTTWRLRSGIDLARGEWLSSSGLFVTEAIRDRDAQRTRSRQDRAELGAQLRFAEKYALRGNGTWRIDYALDEAGWKFTGGDAALKRRAFSAGADLRPITPVQLILGYDREKSSDETTQTLQRQSELARVEGYWFISPDLELRAAGAREDLRDARKIGVAQGLLRRYERRFETDVTYNLQTRLSCFGGYQWRMRRLYDPGASDTKVQNFRVGLNLHVHTAWEVTGQVRYTLLDGEPVAWSEGLTSADELLENHRWIATGEVAWDATRMFRFAVGYETLEYAVDSVADSPDDYAADRFYVKAMQKF